MVPARAASIQTIDMSTLVQVVRIVLDRLRDDPNILASPNALQSIVEAFSAECHRGGAPRDVMRQDPEPAAEDSDRHVRLAETYIDVHLHEPITISDLARAAHVSVRTLQMAFRKHRGSPPHLLVRQKRLDRAREILSSAAFGITVAAVAIDCGYAHFGRFSGEYRKRFGEAPSDTIRRARAALREGIAAAPGAHSSGRIRERDGPTFISAPPRSRSEETFALSPLTRSG